MSDIIKHTVDVVGEIFNKNDDVINVADHNWMRNDFLLENSIPIGDFDYRSVEHGYQASKTDDVKVKELISKSNIYEARRIGREVDLTPNWNAKKFFAMTVLVREKFKNNEHLIFKLLETGNKKIEMIHSTDTYWGVVYKNTIVNTVDRIGQNHLGNILMSLREEFKFRYNYKTVDELSNNDLLKKIVPEESLLEPMCRLFDEVHELVKYNDSLSHHENINVVDCLDDYNDLIQKIKASFTDSKNAIKKEA